MHVGPITESLSPLGNLVPGGVWSDHEASAAILRPQIRSSAPRVPVFLLLVMVDSLPSELAHTCQVLLSHLRGIAMKRGVCWTALSVKPPS